MSKNQSIKSFFTSKTNSVVKKDEEIVAKKDDEKMSPERKPIKQDPVTKTPKNESNKRQRKSSSELKNLSASAKKSKKNESEEEVILEEEKENKKTSKKVLDDDSSDSIKNENKSESSDFDSPIKGNKSLNKSDDAKRRKLVIESSSEDEKSKDEKPKKKSQTKTVVESKKKSPVKKSKSKALKSDSEDEVMRLSEEEKSKVESDDEKLKKKNVKETKKKSPVSKSKALKSESEDEVMQLSDEEKSKKKIVKETKKKSPVSKSKALKSDSEDEVMQLSEEDDEKPTSPKQKTKTSPKNQKLNFFKKEEKKVKEEKTDEIKKEHDDEVTEVKKEVKKELKEEPKEEKKAEGKTSLFFSLKKASGASVSTSDYNPAKDNYHPIKDAFWAKGDPVPYKALAQTLFCMEKTSKRLELLSIVTNYFRSVLALTPKDLIPSMYMLTNKVAPDYEGLELGIGDTVLFKSLAEATGSTLQKLKNEFQAKGDIGLVAEANRCNQKLLFTPKKLTVNAVFNKLRDIASISGNSSQSKKSDLIKSLLVSCDAIEARYLMRSLAGKLRNGLGEQSILVSLAHACTITVPTKNQDEEIVVDRFEKMRSSEQKIEEMKKILDKSNQIVKKAYYQCPNYSIVINAIIEHGLDNLEEYCKLTPGVPLKPMLAYPTKGIHEVLKRFENVEFTCEYKYDGERAQIHILEDGSINIYSRNSENNTGKYPDIIEFLQELLHLKKDKNAKKDGEDKADEVAVENKVTSAILDAEVVAYDIEKKTIQPFQVLSTRKRKDAASEEIKVKVCIFAFDLIYLNNESLIDLPFRQRRDKLYKFFPHVEGKLMFAEKMDASDVEAIQEFLDKSIKDGCEGLMIKTLDEEAHYEISKRSHNWLKLKKDYLEGVGDTLDLVVIGGYLGTGKRTGLYGGYLLACYDPENEEYQTICKLGTGLKDNDLQVQFESLSKIRIDKPKAYYRINDSVEQPDHWFEPEQVWEIKCADFSLSPVHTAAIGLVDRGKGISLRFPRFLRLRDDKKPEDSTSAEQVTEMYKNQQQMLNLNDKEKKDDDDEEDY